MDRSIVYVGELPRFEDFLGFQKSVLYALGDVLQAMVGSSIAVHGLACAPTAPASMQVTVGIGAIYEQETVDATAYGPMGTDANTITKQGLLASPQTLTISAPATSGYSQVYLIQAAYNDLDSGSIVLPYYNSANPSQPLNGPSGSGTSQYTVRGGVCAISLKAGAAAPTGTQVAPAVDSGYVPLYLITVANGQTTITSANIAVYSSAPFIPLTLPQIPSAIQAQSGNWAVDTGSANAMAIALPSYTSLAAGLPIRIKKANSANTGAVTLSVNGGSAFSVLWDDGNAITAGDLPANTIITGVYDGAALRINAPVGPTIYQKVGGSGQSAINHYGTDTSGSANVVVSTVSPALSSLVVGTLCLVVIANTNTTTTTANISGTGAIPIIRPDTGANLNAADLTAGMAALLMYDGSGHWVLLNPALQANRGYRNTLYVTSSQSWTVPAGVTKIRWKAWAAGGGGGAAPSGSSGGGGAAGAYGAGEAAVTPGASITFTVGAGGTAGTGGTNGGNGGDTVVGTFQTLKGGLGGQSVTGTGVVGTGGLPQSGSTGGAVIQSGFAGSSGSSSPYQGGFGGAAVFGGATAPIGPGYSGIFPGGGGGGATANTTPSNGGASGYIEVEY